MRILHLPLNVASHLSTTVRGLQAAGMEARGIVYAGSFRTQSHDHLEVLATVPSRRSPRWWFEVIPRLGRLVEAIRWADVVHWYMAPGLPARMDLTLAARLGKPGVVEFAGGEIRKPSLESAENQYYRAARPDYEYRHWETDRTSRRTQRNFHRAGFEALISCRSLEDYLDSGAFAHIHVVRQRVMTADFAPRFPDPSNRRPLVVHASTAPVVKGTAAVLAAVEQLRGRLDFDFELVQQRPRREALAIVERADIFLDQFVLGAHGSAAVEAMALGKPVIGWIKPSMIDRYPSELPLVSATQEELPAVLEQLLLDGLRREELGRAGRDYAERHHDAVRLAPALRAVYEAVIERQSGANFAHTTSS